MKIKKEYINNHVKDCFPGVNNYYVHYVVDELMEKAQKESIDYPTYLQIDDVMLEYDLSKNEMLQVLFLAKKDLLVNKCNLIDRSSIKIEFKPSTSKLQIDHVINENENLYDDKQHAVSFLGKNFLQNLVYSSTQAKKILRDLITLAIQNNMSSDIQKSFNGYEKNKVTPQSIYTNNDDEISSLIQNLNEADITNASYAYNVRTQKEQIVGMLDEKTNQFIDDLDDSYDVTDPWLDQYDTVEEIWKKRNEVDPSLPTRSVLNDQDQAWISMDADDQLAKQYDLNKVKLNEF